MQIIVRFLLLSAVLTILGCELIHDNSIEYGESKLYFTKLIKQAEAKRLGDFLSSQGVFNGKKKLFQLDKSGNTYKLNAAVKGDMGSDRQVIAAIMEMANAISQHSFDGAPVEILLTDNKFNQL